MPADQRLSLVVLSYNRPRYLERALTSILRQTRRPDEVLIVDNASPASAEIADVAARFPEFSLVRSDINRGFAGGMNLGIGRASHAWVFLTEDDVVLEPDCLAALLDAAGHAEVRLFSGIMIDDERGTVLSAGGQVHLGRRYRMTVLGQDLPARALAMSEPYDVEYIPGAMMLAPRDVWVRLGGFREDFFVYGEDSDLCLRARQAGYCITVVPRARVRHLPPAPGSSAIVAYHKLKNFLALYLLHARLSVLPAFLGRYVLLPLLRADQRGLHLSALRWFLPRVPALLLDRGRIRPAAAAAR